MLKQSSISKVYPRLFIETERYAKIYPSYAKVYPRISIEIVNITRNISLAQIKVQNKV